MGETPLSTFETKRAAAHYTKITFNHLISTILQIGDQTV